MEIRSRVAAAAASVVPFHCVICFDEFNMRERHPVVLPCGHTYVCAPCSKRLKRCMECREPLFLPVQQQNRNQNATGNWAGTAPPMYNRGGRYSPQQQAPLTPKEVSAPPTPIALPIPKNVVLLAMMEAAQRQSQMQESEADAEEESSSGHLNDVDDDEEQFDLNRIISGMATLSGPCGTYAVRERHGLAVVSADPRRKQHVDEEKKSQDRADRDLFNTSPLANHKEPFSLEYGQTVQIVDFEDGVAKLARGHGFIVANSSSQLVKVAGPLDNSCRLEGLLDTVVSRGEGLQRTLDENHHIENSLRKQVEAAGESLPIHPIITEAPKRDDLSMTDSRGAEQSDAQLPSTPTGSSERDVLAQPFLSSSPRTPSRDVIIMQSASMEAEVSMTPQAASAPSPNSIDNADISGPGFPSYRRRNDDEYDLHELALGCGAAFFSGNAALFGESLSKACKGITGSSLTASDAALYNNENTRTVQTSNSSDPGSPNLWQSAPILSTSFDTVDFRSGLSGHRGLTNGAKSSGSSPGNTRGFPRMSDSRGIGMRAPLRGRSPPTPPTLGLQYSPMQRKGSME